MYTNKYQLVLVSRVTNQIGLLIKRKCLCFATKWRPSRAAKYHQTTRGPPAGRVMVLSLSKAKMLIIPGDIQKLDYSRF